MDLELTQEEQAALLALARRTIEAETSGGRLEDALEDFAPSPAMRMILPCFVTLRKHGELRGCIGGLSANEPLYENVAWMAQRAAFFDPRFGPVQAEETPELTIEISVLSAPHAVESYEDVKLGQHGVVLEKGPCRAVYLPDVAEQFGWDREAMLSHLARKAGLPRDGWREGASFQVFTTLKFAEHRD
ncbi:AmmeMemoRadiSam system protein A [Candidatus Sumerlaeota bacterium]|nr:AmmeMemoRadiSam system protein A [Candidatus Sumerlaeota bacterium]